MAHHESQSSEGGRGTVYPPESPPLSVLLVMQRPQQQSFPWDTQGPFVTTSQMSFFLCVSCFPHFFTGVVPDTILQKLLHVNLRVLESFWGS